MKLRPYQQECLEAITADLDIPGASLVVQPTGSGKSFLVASIALLRSPVLILVPSKELLQQNYDKLAMIVPEEEIGIYSASFNRKEIKLFTIATIQSIHRKHELFMDTKLVIIDECHGVNVKELGTMYTSFLRNIGSPKVVGLTATPFRATPGYFRHPDGSLEQTTMVKMLPRMRNKNAREMFWKRVLYVTPHQALVDQGYLVPLRYTVNPLTDYGAIKVNISHSDFSLDSYARDVIGHEANILNTLNEAQKKYDSVLVFCSTIEQAEHLSDVLKGSKSISSNTPKKKRDQIVKDFREGRIKVIFNMGVLLTGFDFPDLRCLVILRPTRSPALYQQMIGRACRVAPGKTEAEIIDLTGTVNQMGPVEEFEVFLQDGWKWNLRSRKCPEWHDKVLYSMKVQE